MLSRVFFFLVSCCKSACGTLSLGKSLAIDSDICCEKRKKRKKEKFKGG